MSNDVQTRLREYGHHLDDVSPALSLEEVLAGTTPQAQPSPRRLIRGWVLVGAAVALVTALLLPLLLLMNRNEPDVVATTTPPTVTTTGQTNTSVPPNTTVAGGGPAPEGTILEASSAIEWQSVTEGDIPFGHVVEVPGGYAIAEAGIDSNTPDSLWTSPDGVAWSRSAVPVDAQRPLLVRTSNGYWLTATEGQPRVWWSADAGDWVEVDTSNVSHLRPFLVPYTDNGLGQPLIDLSPSRADSAWTSNGSVVVGQWLDGGFLGSLVVSESRGAFSEVQAPWGQVPADIIASNGVFFAYVSHRFDSSPGEIWMSTDGVSWDLASAELPFKFDLDSGEPAHYFEVIERDGTFLAQVGYFCYIGTLWQSTDGLAWELIGDTPELGTGSCAGSLHAADFGWVFITDGGTELPEPNVWISVDDGRSWTRLDTDALGMVGGNGSTPRSQLGISVVGDTIFIQSLMVTPGPMWVGSPAPPVIEIDEGACASSLPALSEAPLSVEIRNLTATRSAVIVGEYESGFDRSDLVAYGRDISTRPPFVLAAEIYEVPVDAAVTITLDRTPGRYLVVCMDTTETMVVMPDLILSS